MTFTELLEEKGYKPYKFVIKGKWTEDVDVYSFFTPIKFEHRYVRSNYNTLLEGGITTYFVKNFDFDNPIIFGLYESKKTATLIHPRPIIKRNNRAVTSSGEVITTTFMTTEAVTHVINHEDPELVFKSLFDKSIEFNYL